MLLTAPEYGLWRRSFFWIFVLMIGSYVVYANRAFPHGGSFMGMIYGVLGLIGILILMFFGVRKRSYKSSFGTVESWLQVHIYLGILVFFIIFFHSGFRFHDQVAVTALILLTLVTLSGVVGALLYTFVPPLLSDLESKLTAREISDQMNQLAQAMARLAAGKSVAFQELCATLLSIKRPKPFAGWRMMAPRVIDRAAQTQTGLLGGLERVPANEHADVTQLLALDNQMKELQTFLIQKQRYINTMAAWLYIHLPLSFAMMVAVITHIAAFFYYR